MTRIVIALTASVYLVWGASGLAETGYDLLARCEHGKNATHYDQATERARCLAYLGGVWDGAISIANMSRAPLFCPPTTQASAIAMIFERWAATNPQFLNRDASDAALAAFATAFPCRKP
jgi:predicted component of type VI protein secretion system